MTNVNDVISSLNRNSRLVFAIAAFIIVYTCVCVASYRFVDLGGVAIADLRSNSGYLTVSLTVSVALFGYVQLFWLKPKWPAKFSLVALVPCGLFILAFIQTHRGGWWFKSYGDHGVLSTAINESKPYARWLLGTSAMIDFYGLLNHFVVSISSQKFVPIASAAIMCASTVLLTQHIGAKASVILPCTTPIWIAFSLGYDEYYPFIAGIFLLLALWVCSECDFRVSNTLYVIAGVLPALYVGFVPLTFFVLAKLFNKTMSVKTWLSGVTISSLAYLVAIEFAWPAGHSNYLAVLSDNMNLGDTRNIHNYQGAAMSAKLPFYSFQSAFSPFHLSDLLFVGFFAGGIATIALVFFVGSGMQLGVFKDENKISNLKHLVSLPMVFITWNLLYLWFMIPKLGPIADIDLFFASNLTIAIWAGIVLERIFEFRKSKIRERANVLGAIVSLNGPIVAALVIYGIRR